jgi:hypothetical protein
MEIPFEFLLAGIETAHGTALANPTHNLGLVGTVKPMMERYRPSEQRGKLAEYYRSKTTRKWSEFEGEGPLDVNTLPLLLNALLAGGIDGSGTTAATLTTNLTGNNNDIVFTAVTGGGAGNDIGVTYIDPGVDNSALNVDVDGNIIKVYLATDGDGAITTTGDLLKAAIEAHPVASTLVTVADKAANDGSGVVTAMATTYLTGGAGTTVTTPSGATNSRLWTFVPDMTSDTLESLTLYWGDPNIQVFQAAYGLLDELKITADAGGADGVTMSISGHAQFPSKQAPSEVPAMALGSLMPPQGMQLWIDTATIGSTAVTGRLISAEVTIPSGVTYKYQAAGPAGTLTYSAHGRGVRHAEMKLVFEVPDMTQYDQWVAGTTLKARLRFNGALIETGFYEYVEVDIYGPFESHAWGEYEGSNRTIELTILSEYDATAGHDFCVRVQNDNESL